MLAVKRAYFITSAAGTIAVRTTWETLVKIRNNSIQNLELHPESASILGDGNIIPPECKTKYALYERTAFYFPKWKFVSFPWLTAHVSVYISVTATSTVNKKSWAHA